VGEFELEESPEAKDKEEEGDSEGVGKEDACWEEKEVGDRDEKEGGDSDGKEEGDSDGKEG
jgi:hypothetical protein